MILWTIQSVKVLDRILEQKEYRADWEQIDDLSDQFRNAYTWMALQMERRGISLQGRPPVWAWKQWNAERAMPDLRARAHIPSGTKGVRIELDVPDDLVLLSDFETWHAVLNNHVLSYSEKEHDQTHSREQIEKSWERVFEFGKGDPDWNGTGSSVQATIPKIDKDWIRKVKHFIGR